MQEFFEMCLAAIMISVTLVPVILALLLATFAVNLFSALFKPVTEPLHEMLNGVGEMIPNPLDLIPSPFELKKHFGSTKNVLFIAFVIVFLVFHYLSLGSVNLFEDISLLFPGTALEQVTGYGTYNGTLDIASFFEKPESYLQILIYSFISGLFLQLGCTTRADGAKINIVVKFFYTLLITLFSSVVLGMLPDDLFYISIPEFSLDFSSAGAVAGDSDFMAVVAELQSWGGLLLEKLLGIIPTIVALYFLSRSLSGFSAAFLGGFIAICGVAIGWPEGLSDPNSPGAVFILLVLLTLGELLALLLGEFVNQSVEKWFSDNKTVFSYYNVITLLISYFVYPLLVLSVLCFLSMVTNRFEWALLILSVVSLLVFSLACFVGYKLSRLLITDCGDADGAGFAAAMVVNVPIWLVYIAVFAL